MSHFRGLTVDPDGAQDLDDAFEVTRAGDGWTVRIAIPDCRGAVLHGGSVDLEARALGTTAYSARGVRRHMLPVPLVRDLSLTQEAPKRAMLVTVPVGADLVPGAATVAAGTFGSAGRLSYREANLALANPGNIHHEALVLADVLADGLERRRSASGAIGLRGVAGGFVTDEEGRLVRGAARGAERVVRELMILANAALAEMCAGAGLPVLYRNHRAKPTASRDALLEDLLIAQGGGAPIEAIARRLNLVVGRARLGPAAEGHWGLDLPAYAWFTSPIRRYADLVNQRILLAWAEGGPVPDLDLAETARHLDALADAERDETSDWHRERADRTALGLLRAGAAGTASASDFTGMLRATSDAVPEPLVAEALARLSDGRLTPKDIARLLAASPEAAGKVVAALVARPQEATSVLTHLAQSGEASLPAYVETPVGPDHRRSFVVSAAAEIGGRRLATPPVPASNVKEGRQRAGLILLALAYGAEPPAFAAPAQVPPDAPGPQPSPAVGANQANPRNRLQEACQKRRWPMPRFEVSQSGPSHAPDFAASVVLDIEGAPRRAGPCAGRSRKEAEMAACARMLEALRIR